MTTPTMVTPTMIIPTIDTSPTKFTPAKYILSSPNSHAIHCNTPIDTTTIDTPPTTYMPPTPTHLKTDTSPPMFTPQHRNVPNTLTPQHRHTPNYVHAPNTDTPPITPAIPINTRHSYNARHPFIVDDRYELYTISACYGDSVQLTCPFDHRIRVVSDIYGHSAGISTSGSSAAAGGYQCNYSYGDCVIERNDNRSYIIWNLVRGI